MSIEILAHHGSWKSPDERGTLGAFRRAWDEGLGIAVEVDGPTYGPTVAGWPAGTHIAPTVAHLFAAARQARTLSTIAIRPSTHEVAMTAWSAAVQYGCAHQLVMSAPPGPFGALVEAPSDALPRVATWCRADWTRPRAVDDVLRSLARHHATVVVSPEIDQVDPLACWESLGELVSRTPGRISLATARPSAALRWFGVTAGDLAA